MNQRLSLAFVGAGLVALFPLAILSAGWAAAQQSVWVGLLFRVGVLLLVTSLAWPQLQSLARRLHGVVGWVLLAIVLTLVLRPKLLPVALLLGTLAVVVHYGFRLGTDYFSRRGR